MLGNVTQENAPRASRVIALTPGDPAGVGPLVAAKALRSAWRGVCFALFGAPEIWKKAFQRFGRPRAPFFFAQPEKKIPKFPLGRPSALSGALSFEAVRAGTKAAKEGKAAALVTAPISKEAWFSAGVKFPGHTEFLASACGLSRKDVLMFFCAGNLKVGLLTVHVSLREALRGLSQEAVVRAMVLLKEGLKTHFCFTRPRLALCALNPHAGEGGAFGKEEKEILEPSVQRLRRMGLRVFGPLPADSLFYRCREGEFDAALALYHDQGLIAVKTLAMESAVNVTLGLPFLRTSPDHGTAFDRVRKGNVDERSFACAIRLAMEILSRKKHGR